MSEDNDYEYEIKTAHVVHPSILHSKWRVKLYHVNPQGQWDDMGTGHVSIKKEVQDEYLMTMISETNLTVMFELKLSNEMDFHRQRGTILTWKIKEEEDDDDTAVSFQDKEGIREVWKFLCTLKGKDPQEEMYATEEDDDEILPEPTIENLSYIAREIRPEIPPSRGMKIIEHVMSSNGVYIKKLGDLLEQEEKKLEEKKSECTRITVDTEAGMCKELDPKLSQFENLTLIFTIFKNLLVIADRNLIDMLLSDNFYLITFGALEYDFESLKMIRHRQFFKESAHFNNILNISDEGLLSKIHLNHRTAYLRDTAIGRFIEELTMKNINMSIHLNNSDIIQYFLSNKHLIAKAIEKMMDDNDILTKKDGSSFLLELMSCSKELIQNRIFFYETLCELNLLDALEKTFVEVSPCSEYKKFLTNEEEEMSVEENKIKEEIKINSIEILIYILKNHIVSRSQYKENSLLTEMCNILIHQENFGIKYEIGEILKSLLDNDVTEKKNEFYDLFYNKCLSRLVEFINIPINLSFKYEMTSSKQIIIEIICHCFKQHGNRVTYWAIHNNLIEKTTKVLQDNVKILKLQVIKFLKSVIVNNDENLNKVIIYGDIFKDVLTLYEENKTKNNLILSAILDLFDHLKKSPHSKKIVAYLFEKHSSFFLNEPNKSSFSGLISKFENGNEQVSIPAFYDPDDKLQLQGILSRELSQKEDEDYFNRDEDDSIFRCDTHQLIDQDDIYPNMISDNNIKVINSNLETSKFIGRKTEGDDFEKLYNDPEFKENEEEIYRRINRKSKTEEDDDDSP